MQTLDSFVHASFDLGIIFQLYVLLQGHFLLQFNEDSILFSFKNI